MMPSEETSRDGSTPAEPAVQGEAPDDVTEAAAETRTARVLSDTDRDRVQVVVLLAGDRARLDPLVVFFAVLGGLVVYGPVGFLLGPIVIVVAISVLEIVRAIVYEEMEPSS